MLRLLALLFVSVFFVQSVNAAVTSTMTFNDLVADGDTAVNYFSPYSEVGYILVATAPDSFGEFTALRQNGPPKLETMHRRFPGVISLTKADSGVFSLDSIQLGKLNTAIADDFEVVFTGYLGGGSVGTETKTITAASGLQSFSFGASFSSVDTVEWTMSSPRTHQFDNITVTAVPEPTSLAFLGVGLGVAGVRRVRRKRVENAVA